MTITTAISAARSACTSALSALSSQQATADSAQSALAAKQALLASNAADVLSWQATAGAADSVDGTIATELATAPAIASVIQLQIARLTDALEVAQDAVSNTFTSTVLPSVLSLRAAIRVQLDAEAKTIWDANFSDISGVSTHPILGSTILYKPRQSFEITYGAPIDAISNSFSKYATRENTDAGLLLRSYQAAAGSVALITSLVSYS